MRQLEQVRTAHPRVTTLTATHGCEARDAVAQGWVEVDASAVVTGCGFRGGVSCGYVCDMWFS